VLCLQSLPLVGKKGQLLSFLLHFLLLLCPFHVFFAVELLFLSVCLSVYSLYSSFVVHNVIFVFTVKFHRTANVHASFIVYGPFYNAFFMNLLLYAMINKNEKIFHIDEYLYLPTCVYCVHSCSYVEYIVMRMFIYSLGA